MKKTTDSPEIIVEGYCIYRGPVLIELTDIGEGYSGDYNPGDPEDEPLFRFYVSLYDETEQMYVDLDGCSWCTELSSNIPYEKVIQALKYLMDKVYDLVTGPGMEEYNYWQARNMCEDTLAGMHLGWLENEQT